MRMCLEARYCTILSNAQSFRHVTSFRVSNHGLRSTRQLHSLYVDTVPPTALQAEIAKTFFRTHLPIKSWTGAEWRKQPHSNAAFLTPEIAFIGRSNSGKSSLLNSLLMNRDLCRVGPKPGKTITLHAWSLGPMDPKTKGARKGFKGDIEPKLNVLDMPGYGHGSRGDWGKDIMKYLTSRRQLRRAFVLVNPEHGLKAQDIQMLELLRENGISHQLIATKCDRNSARLLPALLEKLQTSVPVSNGANGQPLLAIISDILATGNLGDGKGNKTLDMSKGLGLGDVRWAILRAAGLEDYAMAFHAGGVKAVKEFTKRADTPTALSDEKEQATSGVIESSARDTDDDQSMVGMSIEDFMANDVSEVPNIQPEEQQVGLMQSIPVKKKGGRIRPRGRPMSKI